MQNRKASFFNKKIYKKRIQCVVEAFLQDANKRAAAQEKKAYVHIVGLGLGVWEINKMQGQWMLDTYANVIRSSDLSHISDIDFSWFPENMQKLNDVTNGGQYKDKNEHNITIHFSKRNPADKLKNEDANKLLVAMYAWDGNAYPGNEYWAGMLTASGDPAAACCSLISSLQNILINPYIKKNIEKEYETFLTTDKQKLVAQKIAVQQKTQRQLLEQRATAEKTEQKAAKTTEQTQQESTSIAQPTAKAKQRTAEAKPEAKQVSPAPTSIKEEPTPTFMQTIGKTLTSLWNGISNILSSSYNWFSSWWKGTK